MAKERYVSPTMAAFIEARKASGLTQEDFYPLMGWANKQSLCVIEQGARQPAINTMEAMLEKLGKKLIVVDIDNEQNTK